MVRVLLVDDCRTARLVLRQALAADAEVEVVGEASNAAEALEAVRRLRPDMVTMDVFLRRENGLDVASAIMREVPRPILVLTGINPSDPQLLYRAIEAGALEVCAKLPGPQHPQYELRRQRLLRLLKSLAQVPVVHRKRRREAGGLPAPSPVPLCSGSSRFELLAIGASTGGPPTVAELLKGLPGPWSFPVALVQHMSPGFMEGFGRWLSEEIRRPVLRVEASQALEPGHVYLATDERHLVCASRRRLSPEDSEARNFQRPSVDVLFESVASHFAADALGVLLTGMGSDGAAGLLRLRGAGARTLAQSPATCAVCTMPESAIARDAVDFVGSPAELAGEIARCMASP